MPLASQYCGAACLTACLRLRLRATSTGAACTACAAGGAGLASPTHECTAGKRGQNQRMPRRRLPARR